MKKVQLLFIALSLATITSCRLGSGKHVTIQTTVDNNIKVKIEYAGRIVFTDDSMGISSMSPNSYFKFKRDNENLEAQSDASGHIVYGYNGNAHLATLDANGKRLLAEAVRQVVKAQKKG